MTRARMIWLGSLAVGLLVAVGLRTTRPPERPPEPVEAPQTPLPLASSEGTEVEVELSDPGESGLAKPERAAAPTGIAAEKELVDSMRERWRAEPERVVTLAELGETRFGESPRAVERRLYEIKALVQLGRIGSARTKAERYLAQYPPGPMTDEVERLTGVHRRPEP